MDFNVYLSALSVSESGEVLLDLGSSTWGFVGLRVCTKDVPLGNSLKGLVVIIISGVRGKAGGG